VRNTEDTGGHEVRMGNAELADLWPIRVLLCQFLWYCPLFLMTDRSRFIQFQSTAVRCVSTFEWLQK
jgi:hypothetical protein